MNNQKDTERLGKNTNKSVEQKYNWENKGKKLNNLYKGMFK